MDLLLHIGHGKAGSSYIQNTLRLNRPGLLARGIHYPPNAGGEPTRAESLTIGTGVAVAFARLYRGAHHPTDVLASVAFAVPWLLVTLRLIGDDPGVPARPARRAEPVGGTR